MRQHHARRVAREAVVVDGVRRLVAGKLIAGIYQWRTPVIAAVRILKGEPVIGPAWKLPQPVITATDLDKFVDNKMPPLHYAMCGCKDLPGYPERWGGKK